MNIVHKPSNMPAVSNTAGNFDPFRTMRELMRFDPFAEMGTISNWQSIQFNPDFEVKETREGYQFRADLPGIKEKDLEISMTGNRLTISGHREAEKRDESDRYYLYERSYGSFSRSFTLPDGVDNTKVAADLKDGVLTMLVPRRPETQPRKINVRANG
ncbi:MAG: Hsp20 family protein [Deltaproteobacteria bacterium]|nr:Hsp20 family protein [Deltaproteobacteria bacterium]